MLDENTSPSLLSGAKFSLLGFGNRNYSTFFENPRHIVEGLVRAGAKLVATESGEKGAQGEGLLTDDVAEGATIERS